MAMINLSFHPVVKAYPIGLRANIALAKLVDTSSDLMLDLLNLMVPHAKQYLINYEILLLLPSHLLFFAVTFSK